MPDPVALQIQPPPNALNTIGGMMGIAQTAQQLKLMQQREQLQNVELVKQRALLPADIEKGKAESQSAQTASAFAQWKLKSEQADKAYQIAGGLIQDPAIVSGDSKGSVKSLMGAEEQMRTHGIPEDQIRVQMAPLYTLAGHKPEALLQSLKNVVVSGIQAQGQGPAVTPSGVQTASGQVTKEINTNPLAGPIGAVIPGTQTQQVLPPTAPVFNPKTQTPGYLGPQSSAPIVRGADVSQGPQPVPIPNTPAQAPVTGPSLSNAQEIPVRTAERVAVNAAAAKVPERHYFNQQIIKLAPIAATGAGSEAWASMFGRMGMQWVPGDLSANFQRMQHFMANQSAEAAAAMGAGTDAARAIAEAATNKSGWTEKAIISTAKVNDALTTGLDLFNQGMEKAIHNAGGNVLAKRDFQNQWAKTFDVRATQLHNALENGDKAEVDRIVDEVGGKKSKGAAALFYKYRAMEELVSKGQLVSKGYR